MDPGYSITYHTEMRALSVTALNFDSFTTETCKHIGNGRRSWKRTCEDRYDITSFDKADVFIWMCWCTISIFKLPSLTCSRYGFCTALQLTTEAFSRSGPCSCYVLVQSTRAAAGSQTLHQSHRWDASLWASCKCSF